MIISLDGTAPFLENESYSMKLFPSLDVANRILTAITSTLTNFSHIVQVLFNEKQPTEPVTFLDSRITDMDGNLKYFNSE